MLSGNVTHVGTSTFDDYHNDVLIIFNTQTVEPSCWTCSRWVARRQRNEVAQSSPASVAGEDTACPQNSGWQAFHSQSCDQRDHSASVFAVGNCCLLLAHPRHWYKRPSASNAMFDHQMCTRHHLTLTLREPCKSHANTVSGKKPPCNCQLDHQHDKRIVDGPS